MPRRKASTEVWLAFAFGIIALSVLFFVALFSSNHNALLITISRVTLSLACAGIAAVIPGFIDIDLKPSVNTAIRAGGAIAVFVLVFFFNPPGLIDPGPQSPANPSEDYMPVVQDWVANIDAGKYEVAYQSASRSTQENYEKGFFLELYKDYLTPLGNLVDRKLIGAASASQLPNGEKGNYRIISYRTQFENGPDQLEQIVVTVEDGSWKVKDHTYYKAPKP